MSDSTALIKVDNVHFSFKRTPILANIDLEIRAEDFLAIIGPNGSGKTTLLKIILGLLEPETGRISLFGSHIDDFKDWGKIGYVPQKATNIDPYFPASVQEVVAMGLLAGRKSNRFSKTDSISRIKHALEMVGMEDKIRRHIGELSGGQQQRVFIARALASEPQVLILDEPTAGVDMETQTMFYDMLDYLNKDRKITIVLVTHDIGVITKHVKKIACINQKLYFHGSHEDFCATKELQGMFGEGSHIICHRH